MLDIKFIRENKEIVQAGADAIHFDVMDHHFVPNLSFGSVVCTALRNDGITADIEDVKIIAASVICGICFNRIQGRS